MQITYTNPAPEEDMFPGEAVHWTHRGARYFDYKDLWFQQLDREFVVNAILVPLACGQDPEAVEWLRDRLVRADDGYRGLRQVGLITQDLALARQMLDRRIDFVADFTSGLFFFDLRGGHEDLMSALYTLYRGEESQHDAMHSYVDRGMGIFRSSQSPKTEVGANTPLPAWVKLAKLDIHRRETT